MALEGLKKKRDFSKKPKPPGEARPASGNSYSSRSTLVASPLRLPAGAAQGVSPGTSTSARQRCPTIGTAIPTSRTTHPGLPVRDDRRNRRARRTPRETPRNGSSQSEYSCRGWSNGAPQPIRSSSPARTRPEDQGTNVWHDNPGIRARPSAPRAHRTPALHQPRGTSPSSPQTEIRLERTSPIASWFPSSSSPRVAHTSRAQLLPRIRLLFFCSQELLAALKTG